MGHITCSDMTSFPTHFPANTKSIILSNMVIDDIPESVIDNLESLQSIKFDASIINRISPKAFSSLSDVDEITFSDVTIGVIDSYAFSDLTDIGSLSFQKATIDTISQYAFSDLFAFDELVLDNVNVTDLHSRAFNNIADVFKLKFSGNYVENFDKFTFSNMEDIIEVVLTGNDIPSMLCEGIEGLLEQADTVSFFANIVPCSCDLIPVMDSSIISKYPYSNWCSFNDGTGSIFVENLTQDMLDCTDKTQTECEERFIDTTLSTTSDIMSSSPGESITETNMIQAAGTVYITHTNGKNIHISNELIADTPTWSPSPIVNSNHGEQEPPFNLPTQHMFDHQPITSSKHPAGLAERHSMATVGGSPKSDRSTNMISNKTSDNEPNRLPSNASNSARISKPIESDTDESTHYSDTASVSSPVGSSESEMSSVMSNNSSNESTSSANQSEKFNVSATASVSSDTVDSLTSSESSLTSSTLVAASSEETTLSHSPKFAGTVLLSDTAAVSANTAEISSTVHVLVFTIALFSVVL